MTSFTSLITLNIVLTVIMYTQTTKEVMQKVTRKIFLLLFFMQLTACSTPHPLIESVDTVFSEFGINEYNYFIIDSKGTTQYNKYHEKIDFGDKWADYLTLPIFITTEIKNDRINEDSLLASYISIRNIHDNLLIKDIIQISEKHSDLFPQNSGDVLSYSKNLTRNIFPEAYSQFCEKELNISTNQLWDTKNILSVTQSISSYFDKQNITGYLPAGKNIQELFPTWYIENIYQLAGWYTFRINKHAVLWNSMTDGKNAILCLKFIDLQHTIAFVLPYRKELFPFDTDGRPDLLLSPLALVILKNVLDPNSNSINYNDSEQKLYSELEEKKKSPYLSLYIKELQANIRNTYKYKEQKEKQKLSKIYNTLFINSLPIEYLDKTPFSTINYVSDRTNASRHFILDKETLITAFSSTQRLEYKADKKKKSIGDQIEITLQLQNKGEISTTKYTIDYEATISSKNKTWEYSITDTDRNHYIIDVVFPWRTLQPNSFNTGFHDKLNIMVTDRDLDEQNKTCTLLWDTIPNKLSCPATDDWRTVQKHFHLSPDKKEITPSNCSGWFVPYLTKKGLNLHIEIIDNIKKNNSFVLADKCWIENEQTGEIVWTPSIFTESLPQTIKVEKDEFTLPEGRYAIYYESNGKHSFESWLSLPPTIDDYGIRLYKTEKTVK